MKEKVRHVDFWIRSGRPLGVLGVGLVRAVEVVVAVAPFVVVVVVVAIALQHANALFNMEWRMS